MPTTIETTVYKFEELSECAKERARDWYRSCMDCSTDLDFTIDDADTIASILGIDIRRTRWTNAYGNSGETIGMYYDLNRGSAVSFDGCYSYAKGARKAIRDYAPQDTTLHRIADDLQAIQRKYFYGLNAEISTTRDNDGINFAADCTDYNKNVWDCDAQELEDCITSFAVWIHTQLVREWEYQNRDEQVDESIVANEYTFDEDGNREG